MAASLSIKESEELTERIMGAIEKMSEVKESPEQVLAKHIGKEEVNYLKENYANEIPYDYSNLYESIIISHKEYALQYQSVPVSEWIEVTDSETFINSIGDRQCTFLVPVHENVNNTDYWDVITGNIDESGDIVFNDETVGWDYKAICYYKIISDLPPLPPSFLPKKP